MFKSLVFLALLGLASAAPTDIDNSSDYLDAIKGVFESENDTPVCKQEIAKFKECFKDVAEGAQQMSDLTTSIPSQQEVFHSVEEIRKALACSGEVTCNKLKLSKYTIETLVYGIEHIYGGGYSCLDRDESALQWTLVGCMISKTPRDHIESANFKAIASNMKPIARCVAEAQNCSDDAKTEFLKGAMAIAEMTEVAVNIAQTVQTGNREYVDTFDKKFDPKEFDNLHL